MAIINVPLEDSFDDWRVKTNLLSTNAGDLELLTTTDKTSIVSAINEVNILSDDIGNIIDLETSYKINTVGAINELNTNTDTNTTDTLTNTNAIASIVSTISARIPYAHDLLEDVGNAGSGLELDTETYDSFKFTCDFNPLILSEVNMAVGRKVTLVLINAGSITITWPVGSIWKGGVAPTFTTTGTDVVELFKIDTGIILATLTGANYS